MHPVNAAKTADPEGNYVRKWWADQLPLGTGGNLFLAFAHAMMRCTACWERARSG